jgi:ribosome maturation factor RimP
MRELWLPLFIKKMTDFKHQVAQLIEDGLAEKQGVFLVDFFVTQDRKILITLDGDKEVTLQDCIDISRAVEHNLDREEIDFELEVASSGVGTPLKLARQYKKNIGRQLIVKTAEGTLNGLLSDANENNITLEWTERQPKKIGKGKETVKITKEISYNEIVEAIVTITF